MASVRRTAAVHGVRDGVPTLEQRFLFEGDGATALAVTSVLLTAPLVGDNSIFGTRPGVEGERTEQARKLRGFSPVAGFRFDVEMTNRDGEFLLRFSQPERRVPFLQGEALWILRDENDGAVLDEQINTTRAIETVGEPLGGPRPSARRWLFFRMGHKQVMDGATKNIASLLG